MCRELYLYPQGLHGALLHACEEEGMVQTRGVLRGQQRGLGGVLHWWALTHPQVHGLGLRAWCVCTGPGAA